MYNFLLDEDGVMLFHDDFVSIISVFNNAGVAIVEVEPTRKKEGSRVTKCSVCGEVVKREVIPKVGGSNTIVTVVIVLAIFAVIAAGGAVFFILSKGNGTGASGAGKKTGGRASINK